MKEYKHIVIDKMGVGLDALRTSLNVSGLETAHSRGIQLSAGSVALEHHLHIFLWDDSIKGITGSLGIINAGNTITVKVRWDKLIESGIIFPGTLKGDTMQNKPPGGPSTNGAWAYKGNIPRNYLYIDGVDSPATHGFSTWQLGKGWQP
ncbi:hypothetical protein [Granulicella tundricola]|uniref:Uncharacterized protein n=1 Tax=Granulicella tundricola (strain ATCC BAA-1859 / DSM 23138 / MP5ACTX9) TaxID=1198114 RepID=E8X252_GRATM|nr:hypothetical protein [Granulicella tundricola]ADW70295.1 hypothetical protein AciX9_3284 [Granulicella tundricola MP5ACTX9]